MANRLLMKLASARREKYKLFCAFLTLGYPSLSVTRRLIEDFEKAGVDILELGFPFSDPLADGPTIQHASEFALRRGVHLRDAFRLVKKVRQKGCRMPILFFTYLNPVVHYGVKKFLRDAKDAGYDGCVIPDLPPEEKEVYEEGRRLDLVQVYLVAPTTEPARARRILHKTRGFVYYVSLRGVTGARKSLADDLKSRLNQLRRWTPKPTLVGFGVSTPAQARKISRLSDGVIVGSAIIEHLGKSGKDISPVTAYVRKMIKGVKGQS